MEIINSYKTEQLLSSKREAEGKLSLLISVLFHSINKKYLFFYPIPLKVTFNMSKHYNFLPPINLHDFSLIVLILLFFMVTKVICRTLEHPFYCVECNERSIKDEK